MLSSFEIDKFSYAHSEIQVKNFLSKRKELGVTDFDVMVFLYLLHFSRRRVFIKLTTAQLAEEINANYSRVTHSIRKLKTLNLCKRIEYSGHKGFIIHPEIINNGDDRKKAFKFKLWKEN